MQEMGTYRYHGPHADKDPWSPNGSRPFYSNFPVHAAAALACIGASSSDRPCSFCSRCSLASRTCCTNATSEKIPIKESFKNKLNTTTNLLKLGSASYRRSWNFNLCQSFVSLIKSITRQYPPVGVKMLNYSRVCQYKFSKPPNPRSPSNVDQMIVIYIVLLTPRCHGWWKG